MVYKVNIKKGSNKNQPENFEIEATTVWSFPKRGAWATHHPKFRGNWAPQIPRNLILRYSKPGDLVLDSMCGSGTTLIECKLTGRNALGFDVNPKMVELSKNSLNFDTDETIPKTKIKINKGNACCLSEVQDNSVDLIATHPPYANIIKYSEGEIEDDLSNISNIDKFCDQMKQVASECYRVLKPSKYCAILMGNTRRKKYFIPMAHKVMQNFIDIGFKLKEDIIKHQWNCKTTPYWANMSKRYNFLMIMHEHLFVFEKCG